MNRFFFSGLIVTFILISFLAVLREWLKRDNEIHDQREVNKGNTERAGQDSLVHDFLAIEIDEGAPPQYILEFDGLHLADSLNYDGPSAAVANVAELGNNQELIYVKVADQRNIHLPSRLLSSVHVRHHIARRGFKNDARLIEIYIRSMDSKAANGIIELAIRSGHLERVSRNEAFTTESQM